MRQSNSRRSQWCRTIVDMTTVLSYPCSCRIKGMLTFFGQDSGQRSVSSSGDKQLQHMISKGKKWGQRITHSPLQPAEVWHSFKTQALPAVKYGLLPLMSSRQMIDDTFSSWYFSFLPSLGINRNIAKEWRTLPRQYQGLGLPQMSLEKLAVSLFYLQQHWDTQQPTGTFLRCIFELCQLEIGREGNFLNLDYDIYGCLATHTWFKYSGSTCTIMA